MLNVSQRQKLNTDELQALAVHEESILYYLNEDRLAAEDESKRNTLLKKELLDKADERKYHLLASKFEADMATSRAALNNR